MRLGDRFLVVHERKHGQLWYLPAGGVEPGESFAEAAIRETLEETGVRVVLEGILRIEQSRRLEGARMRVIYQARVEGDPTPKSLPDQHTLGAAWVRLDELAHYPLRGPDVLELFNYVARGGPRYPLSLLAREGAPWER